jgi:hypothetical protein
MAVTSPKNRMELISGYFIANLHCIQHMPAIGHRSLGIGTMKREGDEIVNEQQEVEGRNAVDDGQDG